MKTELMRLIVICDIIPTLFQLYSQARPVQNEYQEDHRMRDELLHHFQPSLNNDRLGLVNTILEQLDRHANEKHSRSSPPGRHIQKALDLENFTLAALNEIDGGNIKVDNDTDEYTSPDSPAVSPSVNKFLFEGDILLTPEQGKSMLKSLVHDRSTRSRKTRTALISGDSTRWQSLPIRYDFDKTLDDGDKEAIKSALEYWQTHTCVWFQYAQGATDGDYLSFFKGNGCYSMVGKVGGKQGISIGDGCAQLGVASHEIGHSLGMWHEQSRPDSDQFIRVVSSNVIDGTLSNFLQRSWTETNTYGVSYDLGSVMHYGPSAFAVDGGKFTIETIIPGFQKTVGQREHPSFLDVMTINKAYCDNRCSEPLACRYGGYPHPSSCKECICPNGLTGTYCEKPEKSKNADCGGIVEIHEQWTNISSPNYPKWYGTNQRCVWMLRAEPKSHVRFEFFDTFKMSCSPTCYDYVEIKNDTDFTRTGMRFCCKDRPKDTFYSATHEMLIIFNSQSTIDIGFKGRAIADSNGNGGGYTETNSTASTKVSSASSTTGTTTTTIPITTVSTSTTITTTAVLTTSAPETSTTIESSTAISSQSTQSTSSPVTFTIGPVITTDTGSTVLGSSWSVWSAWSDCSKTCGACGVKSRQRKCLEESCMGESKQFKRCPMNVCPGDTTCSKLAFLDYPCGGGGRVCSRLQEVSVKCTFPSCCGPFKAVKTQCELPRRPLVPWMAVLDAVDEGNWGEWSEWGECFGPRCGGCARQVRYRVCQDDKCRGDDREFRPCNTAACSSCTDSSSPDLVEAPCTDPSQRNRTDMCRRKARQDETTCPCCPPLKEENGRCVL